MKKQTDPLVTKFFNSFDGKNGTTIKPLSKNEELRLFRAWKHNGDQKALDKLIISNAKFVVRCANKFKRHCDGKTIDINDLIQAGNEGMLQAVRHFKTSKKARFITCAVWWINAYIRDFIYKNVSTVQLPMSNATKSIIDHKWVVFNLANDKDPDALVQWEKQIKDKYKVSDKQIKIEEKKIQSIFCTFSMDKKNKNIFAEETENLHDTISDGENPEQLAIDKQNQNLIKRKINLALKALPQKYREIIRLRHGIGKIGNDQISTLQSVCGKYGVSRERIRQLEVKALKQIKEKLKNDPAILEVLSC